MKNYLIQEYNRKTKRYRSLGAVLAKTTEEARLKYIELSGWSPTKDFLLHAEGIDQIKENQ
jgi:molecular chaperone DnaK (HSP70)